MKEHTYTPYVRANARFSKNKYLDLAKFSLSHEDFVHVPSGRHTPALPR